MKDILIINQYGSTPNTGFGGRTFYMAKSLARYSNLTVVYGSYHHQLRSADHQKPHVNHDYDNPFSICVLKLFKYSSSRSIFRIINWFIFSIKLCFLSKETIGFRPSCIVYSSPALPGYLGAYILARRLSCPLFLEVRDIWPLSIIDLGRFSSRNWLVMLLAQIEKFAYKTADGVVSNLYDLPRHISKTVGKPIRFHFSPNGVDSNNSQIEESDKTSKALDKMLHKVNSWRDAGKSVVGYVGGLAQANSMDLLIDTASLAREDSELVFIIVGDGPEKERLEVKCLELGLTNIYFYSGVPKCHVHLALNAMDILFLANHFKEIYSYGVSPMKLPEYLESTKPIIHVTNARSLLDDVGCWEVVREHEPEAVLRSLYKIKKLPAGEKLRAGMQAKNYTKSNLNYDTVGDSLIAFLDDLGL
jgi:glycosyltransferase involved in cell wall biosynthesis